MNKTIAVIQARMSSTRLPGKILTPFSNGMTILDFQLNTLLKTFSNENIFIATTKKNADDKIETRYGDRVNVFRGSESDVMSRFTQITRKTDAGTILRMAADNPFIFYEGIEHLLDIHHKNQADYTTFSLDNIPSMLIPNGLFVEIVDRNALLQCSREASALEREHVTFGIYNRLAEQFRIQYIDLENTFLFLADRHLRFTVDTREDFHTIDGIIQALDLSGEINLSVLKTVVEYVQNTDIMERMKKETRKTINSKNYKD